MSTTTTSVYVRNLTVTLSIEDAEDRMVHAVLGVARTYAPSRVTVRYSAFIAPGGEISGPVRKKDGTFGRVQVTEYWSYADAPEWLKAAADAERPEWARR